MNSLISRRSRVVGLALSLASLSACDQCQQSLLTKGNLDRVADVVVVNRDDGSSVAISSNPELQVLRVLDLTVGRFTEAPNRFSPLSIPTGPETRQLTLAVDAATGGIDNKALFALDVSDDVVQVVRLEDKGTAPAFGTVARFDTGPGPVDVAAIVVGGATIVAVTRDDAASDVALFSVENDVVTELAPVSLPPVGAHAGAIVADPLGHAFVVADAALAQVHILDVNDDGTVAFNRSLDVGGSVSRLAAGVVDVGDGLAPVVLALRSDESAATLVRLFRPGFREDRYAVVGGLALPSLAVEAYVPDARPSDATTTICCRGLSDDALADGEATDAFATVWMANGDVVYVALAADSVDGAALPAGRRLVRLIDDDVDGLSAPEGVDLNADEGLWVPAEGGDRFRPSVTLTPLDNFGAPPFVPLVDAGTALLLTWEGDLPRIRNLSGTFNDGDQSFTAGRDLVGRGARVGDNARLVQENPNGTCTTPELRAAITAISVDGGTVTLDFDTDAATVSNCLNEPASSVRLTIEVAGSFVVDSAGVFVGRLANVGSGVDDSVALAGASLTVALSSAGAPVRGSKLAVPLDAHVTPMGLNLASDLGQAALIPTAIAGGTLVIPDASSDAADGATVAARRMVLTSGSIDSRSGLPLLFTSDEAETSSDRVETFR